MLSGVSGMVRPKSLIQQSDVLPNHCGYTAIAELGITGFSIREAEGSFQLGKTLLL
jgi:hypothetical protein